MKKTKIIVICFVSLSALVAFLAGGFNRKTDIDTWSIPKDSCHAFHVTGVSFGTHNSCKVCEIKGIESLICAEPIGGDHGFYNSSKSDIEIHLINNQIEICAGNHCWNKEEAAKQQIITEF